MPMQWNDQADARLFANVLKLHVVKLDYHALARAMGSGVTAKAISHRISKIKDKARQYGKEHAWAFEGGLDEYLTGPSARTVASKAHRHGNRRGHYPSSSVSKNAQFEHPSDDSDVDEGKDKLALKLDTVEWRKHVLSTWTGEMEGESDEERPIWKWRSRRTNTGKGMGDGVKRELEEDGRKDEKKSEQSGEGFGAPPGQQELMEIDAPPPPTATLAPTNTTDTAGLILSHPPQQQLPYLPPSQHYHLPLVHQQQSQQQPGSFAFPPTSSMTFAAMTHIQRPTHHQHISPASNGTDTSLNASLNVHGDTATTITTTTTVVTAAGES